MTIFRYWTKSAIECWERECRCDGCEIQSMIEGRCQMAASVNELLSIYGPPLQVENLYPDLTDSENRVISAIIHGANSLEEIGEKIGLSGGSVSALLRPVYLYFENEINFAKPREKFITLTKYLQKKHCAEEDKENKKK